MNMMEQIVYFGIASGPHKELDLKARCAILNADTAAEMWNVSDEVDKSYKSK